MRDLGWRVSALALGAACSWSVLVPTAPAWAQQVRNLTNFPSEGFIVSRAALDEAGTALYAVSTSNQFGTNPGYSPQIMRWEPATGVGSQVSSLAQGVESVSVSDDGAWLAFVSCSNPVGANHDASSELFVMASDGTDILQLTDDPALDAGALGSAIISGSGNRVVFVSNRDPLGTNPGRFDQVFIVGRDGTGLRQLTHAPVAPADFAPIKISISDDGERVAVTHTADLTGSNPSGRSQVFTIQSDGTGLRQLTNATDGGVYDLALSGNGARVAFFTDATFGSGPSGESRIYKIDWDGTGLLQVASPRATSPSITDNGQTVVYQLRDSVNSSTQIWKVDSDGTGSAQLTSGALDINYAPLVSGDGSRVVFGAYGGEYSGGNNPDGGNELMAMDGSGAGLRQLTVLSADGTADAAELTSDGSRLFFFSTSNLFGSNPDHRYQIFRIQTDGTGLAQVTSLDEIDAVNLSVSQDGNLVVFSTLPEYGGSTGNDIYKINADGTGMVRLTPLTNGVYKVSPVLRFDGQFVVFQGSLTLGSNVDGSAELFRVRINGLSLAPITADDDDIYKVARLSETNPAWIAFQSGSNKDGLNTDGSIEIFRIKFDGTGLERLTADPVHASQEPDISADANRIVYVSYADPLGTNPEHNGEIFLYDVPTTTRRQLSFTKAGESLTPRIMKDGSWVYFSSSAPFFESNPDGHFEPYRVSVATGVVERIGGTRRSGATMAAGGFRHRIAVSPDRAGIRAVFSGYGDWNFQNPDLSSEAYLVDQSVRGEILVGKTAPTLVAWGTEPKPRRYDVIRGNVANLSPGGGNTVSLGPVVCLEDDSPDSDIRGNEDAVQPAAGHAFFYLHRGSQGLGDGPGSFGLGTGGAERIAGSGSCLP